MSRECNVLSDVHLRHVKWLGGQHLRQGAIECVYSHTSYQTSVCGSDLSLYVSLHSIFIEYFWINIFKSSNKIFIIPLAGNSIQKPIFCVCFSKLEWEFLVLYILIHDFFWFLSWISRLIFSVSPIQNFHSPFSLVRLSIVV